MFLLMFLLILHIIILGVLAVNIGKIVDKKGRKKIGYQLLVIGMWIGGEVLGTILGNVLALIVGMYDVRELYIFGSLLVFFFRWGGAITGAVIAFQIAHKVRHLENADERNPDISYVDSLQAHEHFHATSPKPRPTIDGYTDRVEKDQQVLDDRIQR